MSVEHEKQLAAEAAAEGRDGPWHRAGAAVPGGHPELLLPAEPGCRSGWLL
ncbi:hypothetical protein ABZS81_09925 [Streptomyces sp. NPDC005318]|uniref:hypothetical protein n=1 Tax=Streptomyces sp. NPDC005318 TaxID=3157031 RepID=UPI0033AAC5CC